MDWKYLLTSYEGRINRAKFWAGVGILFVGSIVATIVDNVIGTTVADLPYGYVYFLYVLISLYFVFAISSAGTTVTNPAGGH